MSLTPPLVARLVTAEFVAALLVLPALLVIPAPYGRYRRPGFGPMMPAHLAWVLMELPAVVVPVWAFLAAGGASRGPVPWLLLALWELHYVQRTFVFPFAMRGRHATKPVLTALFLAGLATNLHADHILRTLRRPGEDGYRIPHGGAFRWVSAANYFDELVEWTGFALAAMTPAAWAFAAFTAANLVPRAITHHKWYRATFPDYPTERRAVVPYLL
jgi:3-oxo-5-alpha-steroid 4-dehydrogenase 1